MDIGSVDRRVDGNDVHECGEKYTGRNVADGDGADARLDVFEAGRQQPEWDSAERAGRVGRHGVLLCGEQSVDRDIASVSV